MALRCSTVRAHLTTHARPLSPCLQPTRGATEATLGRLLLDMTFANERLKFTKVDLSVIKNSWDRHTPVDVSFFLVDMQE